MESWGLGLNDRANNSKHPPTARHLTGCFIFINPFHQIPWGRYKEFQLRGRLHFLGLREVKWHAHGQTSELEWKHGFSYSQSHTLSIWPLHGSAPSTTAATFAVGCILHSSSFLAAWNSPKARGPCHCRSTLTVSSAWVAFCFGEHFLMSLLESKKEERTKESILDWKRNQVHDLHWNKSSSLEMSTFVWSVLKIWLRCRLLSWPQVTTWHLIFLGCQVG